MKGRSNTSRSALAVAAAVGVLVVGSGAAALSGGGEASSVSESTTTTETTTTSTSVVPTTAVTTTSADTTTTVAVTTTVTTTAPPPDVEPSPAPTKPSIGDAAFGLCTAFADRPQPGNSQGWQRLHDAADGDVEGFCAAVTAGQEDRRSAGTDRPGEGGRPDEVGPGPSAGPPTEERPGPGPGTRGAERGNGKGAGRR